MKGDGCTSWLIHSITVQESNILNNTNFTVQFLVMYGLLNIHLIVEQRCDKCKLPIINLHT